MGIGEQVSNRQRDPTDCGDQTEMQYSSPSLRRVDAGGLCSGCGACALAAPGKIDMHLTKSGYLRPTQSAGLAVSEERMIRDTCPGLSLHISAQGRTDSVLWGPYVSMKTGHSLSDRIRQQGSSGGGITAVLVHLLETGQIDAVIQTGADPVIPNANTAVVSVSEDEIITAAGSRYAPSAPLADLGPLLDGGLTYAFVGKPCDAAALRAMARTDSRIDQRIPWILSFYCAGVPSLRGSDKVIEALGTTTAETAAFRYRGNGWPGRATATARDGSELSMSYNDSWGKILSKHLQHRCKVCADGTGNFADLVCADAWDCDENGYPVFEEADGTSLFVARTQKGAALLAEAESAKKLELKDFDVKTLAAMQPGQTKRRRALFARMLALRLTLKPVPRYTGLSVFAAARQNDMKSNMVNFIGMVRRSLKTRTTGRNFE